MLHSAYQNGEKARGTEMWRVFYCQVSYKLIYNQYVMIVLWS